MENTQTQGGLGEIQAGGEEGIYFIPYLPIVGVEDNESGDNDGGSEGKASEGEDTHLGQNSKN